MHRQTHPSPITLSFRLMCSPNVVRNDIECRMCCSVFLTSMRNVKRSVVTCQIKNIFDIFVFSVWFSEHQHFLVLLDFPSTRLPLAFVQLACSFVRITSDFATFVVYCLFHILSADACFYLVSKYLYNGVSSSSLFVFPVVHTQLLPFSIDSSFLSVFLISHSFSITLPLPLIPFLSSSFPIVL